MANIDLIELALTAPLDWEKFEVIVCELLADDDLPRLRRLGGRNDYGLDGIQEAFYASEASVDVAVQITSQKAQRVKVADTLAKFSEHNIKPHLLVMVFRDECSSSTRREILAQGAKAEIQIDPRDRSYLVQQLGRTGSKVFARHLDGDLKKQVQVLLDKPDPLNLAPDALKRSVFASMAAYSLSPHTRLVKGKLFERTVLAVIAASKISIDAQAINLQVRKLLPECAIDEAQITNALHVLQSSGEIERKNDEFIASQNALACVGKAIIEVDKAHSELHEWVIQSCASSEKLDDATKGYIERNVRDAIALIVRLIAPFDKDAKLPLDNSTEKELLKLLSRNVSESIGRKALAAIAGYVDNNERRKILAPFVRAYTTLAIRNIDPLGKCWQASVLERSMIALDTDAVLKLVVVDLPEHAVIKDAINGLATVGIKIIVPDHVLNEAINHIERAPRTYNRFKDIIGSLPLASVDAKVWHAVVRGFAYARCIRSVTWDIYYSDYYDAEEPLAYFTRLLNKRAPVVFQDLHEIPKEDLPVLTALSEEILDKKEQSKLKAEFRGDELKSERVERDLRMLFSMSAMQSSSVYTAKGYLATEDRCLFFAERNQAWGQRPRVALMTRTLPELASFVCGTRLTDSDMVRLVFEPIIVATADLLQDEIEILTCTGADLHMESLDQLEWKLEKGLRKRIHEFSEAEASGDPDIASKAGLNLLEESNHQGIPLNPAVAKVAENYRLLEQSSVADRTELDHLRETLKSALYEVAGDSTKGKTRANRVLKALGLESQSKPSNY